MQASPMRPEALLAIRSDIASTVESEYLAWLTKEHTLERVSIEGFVSARIFRSQQNGFGRYLILYALADETVVDSPAYLDRLNNPTPWSARMMPHLGNFVRGGGKITTLSGSGHGAVLVAIMTTSKIYAHQKQGIEAISEVPGVVAIRVLKTDSKRTTVGSSERKLRSGDHSFEMLMMIETFDISTAKDAGKKIPPKFLDALESGPTSHEIAVYSQIFSLNGQ